MPKTEGLTLFNKLAKLFSEFLSARMQKAASDRLASTGAMMITSIITLPAGRMVTIEIDPEVPSNEANSMLNKLTNCALYS